MYWIVIAVLLPAAASHGWLAFPPTRFPPARSPIGSASLWFNQGCSIGCSNCTGADCTLAACCDKPSKPTIVDKKQLTFPNFAWINKHTPWRAPGHAPVVSPCGLAGGWFTPHPKNGGFPPPGIKQGTDGRDDPPTPPAKTTWEAGSVQEVGWMIAANHGGGYAYRLCPKSKDATEECFQSHHLDFVGNESWIQYHGNKSNRTAIRAVRVSEGTNPAGSQWTKMPMPCCAGFACGYHTSCHRPQAGVSVPIPGWYGSGPTNACATAPDGTPAEVQANCPAFFDFAIVDKVSVPSNLPAGEYLLSWRWDCEQTPQIWANCAEITVAVPVVV